MIIKYKVQRPHQNDKYSRVVFIGIEDKIVSKKELLFAIKEGWTVVRKEYFLITHFLDFWRKLNTSDRIKTVGITIAIIALTVKLIDMLNG
jgi:hypothetical protein